MHRSECMRVPKSNVWAPPEVVLAVTLSHPNLVRSYKYALALHQAPAVPRGEIKPRMPHYFLLSGSFAFLLFCVKPRHGHDISVYALALHQAPAVPHSEIKPSCPASFCFLLFCFLYFLCPNHAMAIIIPSFPFPDCLHHCIIVEGLSVTRSWSVCCALEVSCSCWPYQ